MSNINNNIDELLKSSFDHFEANPPADVWNGIQQNMVNAGSQASGNIGIKSAAIKSTGIVTKVIVGIVSGASIIAGGYLVSKYFYSQSDKQKVTTTIQSTSSKEIKTQENLNVLSGHKKDNIQNTTSDFQRKKAEKKPAMQSSTVLDKGENVEQINKIVETGKQTDLKAESKPNISSSQKQNAVIPPPVPKPKHFDFNQQVQPTVPEAEQAEAAPVIYNAFSPNNDGHNDRYVITIENEIFYELKIYDKDEKLVFESNSKDKTWDGTRFNSGDICEQGTYKGIFRYQYKGKEVKQKPVFINLLR